jgi:hypothetical protein
MEVEAMATQVDTVRAGWRAQDGMSSQVSYTGNLVTILLGAWLVAGLMVDAWAHQNLARLETFFTPWHAMFYSGFLATAGWIVWTVGRRVRAEHSWTAIPRGYRLGLVGIAIFGVGGIGDMLWHIIFGIEKNIAALLSPTHLLLFLGGMLILTTPLRAEWGAPGSPEATRSLRQFLPALLSIALATTLTTFITMYVWAFTHRLPFQTQQTQYVVASGFGELTQVAGVADILWSNVVLMVPVLLLLRRWRLPFGSVTLLLVLTTTLMEIPVEFHTYENMIVALVVGLLADGLIAALRLAPGGANGAYRAFAMMVPLLLWGGYMLAGQLRYGLAWSPELWAGAIVLTSLSGLGLSLLLTVSDAIPGPSNPSPALPRS